MVISKLNPRVLILPLLSRGSNREDRGNEVETHAMSQGVCHALENCHHTILCFLIHDISTAVVLVHSPDVAVPSPAKLKRKRGKFYKNLTPIVFYEVTLLQENI